MNVAIVKGKLKADPVKSYTSVKQVPVAYFTLVVPKILSKEKREENIKNGYPTADFINVLVWGNLAELCEKYLQKGSNVLVNGSIQTRNYTKNGVTKYFTEVVANSVEFLDWDYRVTDVNNNVNDYGYEYENTNRDKSKDKIRNKDTNSNTKTNIDINDGNNVSNENDINDDKSIDINDFDFPEGFTLDDIPI